MSASAKSWPPNSSRPLTGDKLPYSDGVPLESPHHRLQIELVIDTFARHMGPRTDYFVGGEMFFYYSLLQTKRYDYRRPDFFVVLGGKQRQRKLWRSESGTVGGL